VLRPPMLFTRLRPASGGEDRTRTTGPDDGHMSHVATLALLRPCSPLNDAATTQRHRPWASSAANGCKSAVNGRPSTPDVVSPAARRRCRPCVRGSSASRARAHPTNRRSSTARSDRAFAAAKCLVKRKRNHSVAQLITTRRAVGGRRFAGAHCRSPGIATEIHWTTPS
jgi:hypothetical protein